MLDPLGGSTHQVTDERKEVMVKDLAGVKGLNPGQLDAKMRVRSMNRNTSINQDTIGLNNGVQIQVDTPVRDTRSRTLSNAANATNTATTGQSGISSPSKLPARDSGNSLASASASDASPEILAGSGAGAGTREGASVIALAGDAPMIATANAATTETKTEDKGSSPEN
jgi:hypothetical protein